jgi:hypothetical protein
MRVCGINGSTPNARSNCQNAVPTVTASVASAAAANGAMNRKAAVRRAMEATDDPEGCTMRAFKTRKATISVSIDTQKNM